MAGRVACRQSACAAQRFDFPVRVRVVRSNLLRTLLNRTNYYVIEGRITRALHCHADRSINLYRPVCFAVLAARESAGRPTPVA